LSSDLLQLTLKLRNPSLTGFEFPLESGIWLRGHLRHRGLSHALMGSLAGWWYGTLRFLLLWEGKDPFSTLLLRLCLKRFLLFLLDDGELIGSRL
jgi:hypothetical protein